MKKTHKTSARRSLIWYVSLHYSRILVSVTIKRHYGKSIFH